jgi:hypothetical protein
MNLSDMQKVQPWTVPYSADFTCIAHGELPHLYGTHAVLHAMKTVGKLGTVLALRCNFQADGACFLS